LVLGQWTKGKKFKYELAIVNNESAKAIPLGGTLKVL
jgi:branched-chain amino acid transport system substrate-binding protein